MRLDRTAALRVFAPMRRWRGRSDGAAIPILMYHSIADDVEQGRRPYYRTVTSPRVFAEQVQSLQRAGYRTLRLSEAVAWLQAGPSTTTAAAGNRVVLTFDDGFRDFRTHAFPLLEQAGFTATMFVATGYLGSTFPTGRPCLLEREVRELSDSGIEFGSHTVTHRQMEMLRPADIAGELRDSRKAIEDITGRRVCLFSYPYRFPEGNARFVASLRAQLDDCGYTGGVTTMIGRANGRHDARFLPRLPVNDCDDEPLFVAKLDGAYDWMHTVQYWRKKARAGLKGRPHAAAT